MCLLFSFPPLPLSSYCPYSVNFQFSTANVFQLLLSKFKIFHSLTVQLIHLPYCHFHYCPYFPTAYFFFLFYVPYFVSTTALIFLLRILLFVFLIFVSTTALIVPTTFFYSAAGTNINCAVKIGWTEHYSTATNIVCVLAITKDPYSLRKKVVGVMSAYRISPCIQFIDRLSVMKDPLTLNFFDVVDVMQA